MRRWLFQNRKSSHIPLCLEHEAEKMEGRGDRAAAAEHQSTVCEWGSVVKLLSFTDSQGVR